MSTETDQMQIPGTEKPAIKEVEDAAKSYVIARDERMELTKKEVERRTILLDRMHTHGLSTYEFDGYKVTVKPGKEKVQVRMADDEDVDDDGEGEGAD